jgi:plastocyanin
MKHLKFTVILFALALVLCSAIATFADQSSAPTPAPYVIQISNNAFSPDSLTVPVGSTVTWKNEDPYAHTVTMQGKNGFDSGSLDSGKTFSHTFTAPGSYSYFCAVHPSMTATITVTAPFQ